MTPPRLLKAIDVAIAKAKDSPDLSNLPFELRIVAIVHAAQGVIDNGGLQYFFEADFPGKPPYSMFVDAYREIGASDEALVLEQAVRCSRSGIHISMYETGTGSWTVSRIRMGMK